MILMSNVKEFDKEKMESVIKKIQKALALANDNKKNPEESETAMLMAQKLMAKYQLSMNDVEVADDSKQAIEGDGTDYTRLQWWMKIVANIIADNFKCYCYLRTSNKKSKIIFLGLEHDVEICKMVYKFALSSIKYQADNYIRRSGVNGDRAYTVAVKNDYIAGYIQGLKDKFKEQVNKEEWGLVLVKDALVEQKFNELKLRSGRASQRSSKGDAEAQMQGYNDGKNFSHKKKAIGG
jgi:Protein of unknown function (DUF2786)